MNVKEQLNKLKENWLLVLLPIILIIILVTIFSGSFDSSLSNTAEFYSEKQLESVRSSNYYEHDFAPEIEERKITKNADITNEIQRGNFYEEEKNLLKIIDSSNSIIINQRTNKFGKDSKAYMTGTYNVKVDVTKYDSVISQIKEIGEVTRFSESQQDITGTFKNLKIEIESEKERLENYRNLLDEKSNIKEKIELTDRIFDQERRIKYLENSLRNVDNRINYSTLFVSLEEKRSEYSIEFVKISRLIENLIGSTNAVLEFIFLIIPWAVLGFVGYKIYKRKNSFLK